MMLIGHLAADVEARQTQNGHVLATFPVATNRISKSGNGEKAEVADFHRIVAWRGLGEVCQKYLSKGMAVYIDGRLVNNSFEDKDGHRHYRTEIVADNLNILTSNKQRGGKEEIGIREIVEQELVAA